MVDTGINMILMGKGGVGKSFVAAMLAQYLQDRYGRVYCADTDPTNATFSKYKALNVRYVDILTTDMAIDRSRIDQLVEDILDHDVPAVIDNGASSYIPIMGYALETSFISSLKEAGREIRVHAVLIGGQGMNETLLVLEAILELLPAKVVVWENEFLGPVAKDGRTFVQSALYKEYRDKIAGVVRIPQRSPDTFGRDLNRMTQAALTFAEIRDSKDFLFMTRQRLADVRRDLYAQLDLIFPEPGNSERADAFAADEEAKDERDI